MPTSILVVLAILWLLGFSLNVGGALIHLLAAAALVILIMNLLGAPRTA